MSLLEAHDISHQFAASDGQTTAALEDISLTLEAGTFTCLIGASGSGKSTLIRILGGLLKPTQGQVLFDGQSLTRPRREISIVFQQDNLMPWRTVYDNIALPLQLAGYSAARQRQQVEHLIQITGLNGFEEQYPAELSGGMAQRVAIARGLTIKPDLLLLDEPFGALDALTRETMWQELLRIWQKTNATILMVTHSIDEAIFLSDTVKVMSARPGHILASFDIPFERPREHTLLTDPRFHQLSAQIRVSIQR